MGSRNCTNCKYFTKSPTDEPCKDCSSDGSNYIFEDGNDFEDFKTMLNSATKHHKAELLLAYEQGKSEAYADCIKFVEEWDSVIAESLARYVKGKN